MQEKQTTKAIQTGNSAAHDGDAVGDAFLFECDKRTDRTLYRELYGLDADQVLRYRTHFYKKIFLPLLNVPLNADPIDLDESNNDNRLPAVLNAHANLVVRRRAVGPELKESFQKFLITVEELWEDQPNDLIDAAYFGFWHHYPKDFP